MTLPLLLLALLSPAHAIPFLLRNLPKTDRASYEAAVAPALQAAKTMMPAAGERKEYSGDVVVAPVVFESAWEQVDAPPPLWPEHRDYGFQRVADWTNYRIVDALRGRGLTVFTPDAVGIEGGGDKRRAVEGRNFKTNKAIPVKVFVTQQRAGWTAAHFEDIRRKVPSVGAVIFTRIHNTWLYEGHSQVEDEGLVNYKVPHAIDVWVCGGLSDCVHVDAWNSGVGALLKPMPLKVASDKKKQAELDDWSTNFSAHYHAQLALAAVDSVAVLKKASGASMIVAPMTGARLVSKLNGKCAEIKGAAAQGAELHMKPCDKKSAAQKFDRTASGELRSGALCVSSNGAGGNNGDKLILWPCVGTLNQRWLSRSGGMWEGMNGRCIAINGADKNDGAALLLWDCTGTHLNDVWSLE